jgi:uncharacterized caspase-like protein
MTRQIVAAALALVLFAVAAGAGWAQTPEKRVALVIGNDAYQTLPRLVNAASDARDIGRALEGAGFETTIKTDVKRREMYQLIDAFAAKISGSPDTAGLFYYAGHGIQTSGKNYLVPVDAAVTSDADLEPEAVDAEKVLRAMDQARNRINIVLLDACRDNPLPKGRSLTRGLTSMHAPRGTFIGYAAAPGHTAQDGEPGQNGAFTGVLVKELAVPGVQLEEVFKRVIAGVSERTGGKQLPWMESSVQGNFFFLPAHAAAPHPTPDVSAAVAPPIAAQTPDALYTEGEAARRRSDYGEAMRLFRAAADKGHARAAVFVGVGYMNAWGVPSDYGEAMRWYRKAADSGDGFAMNNIGWLYQNGWGVPRDYAEAMRWYRQATKTEHAVAFNNIGVLYNKGWGVPQDYHEAMRWFSEAAQKGSSWGMRNTGWAIEHGLGVRKDIDAAAEWYRRAAALTQDPDQRLGAVNARANLARLGR